MKILLTGGAGFIGSHIVDALIEQKHTVVVVDDLSSGKKEFVNNIASFVEADVTDFYRLENVFKKYGPFDIINHHAAQKSVSQSVKDPVFDAKINIIGTLNLLELATKNKVKKFIFASTGGAIYGDEVALPTPESALAEPSSPYGIAKLSAEHYLNYYQSQGMTTQILRYSNVYGPRQDPFGEAGVVAIFCQQIANHKSPTITGDGQQTRDFVYVGDIVEANVALINYNRSGTWNVGSGVETSINQIADSLVKIAKASLSPQHIAARPGEQKRSCLDASKIKNQLNWQAKTILQRGLEQTFQSFATKNER